MVPKSEPAILVPLITRNVTRKRDSKTWQQKPCGAFGTFVTIRATNLSLSKHFTTEFRVAPQRIEAKLSQPLYGKNR
jgi:hypothetical protein